MTDTSTKAVGRLIKIPRDMNPDDYEKAVAFVRGGGVPRVADLQRHFGNIGYTAAAVLMEGMEGAGIVSKCDHLGRRTVQQWSE